MKIEKKKVRGNIKLSSVKKATIASTLGMAATASLIACAESGDPMISDIPDNEPAPESSNSDDFSSSSKYLDIPQSHEAISSEVLEALSSAAESSSSTEKAISSSTQQSSNSTPPASSAEQASSSSDIPVSSAEATSSANPTSSASAPTSSAASNASSSSSYNGWHTDPVGNICDGKPAGTTIEQGFQVIICPDTSRSNGNFGEFHGFSMVTTFEMSDIQA